MQRGSLVGGRLELELKLSASTFRCLLVLTCSSRVTVRVCDGQRALVREQRLHERRLAATAAAKVKAVQQQQRDQTRQTPH